MQSAVVVTKTCDMGRVFPPLSLFWSSVLMRNGHLNSFRQALEDPGMDGTKPEVRWQTLTASLNAIKRAVGRGGAATADRRQ
jgi:hypothetical protein